MAKTLVGVLRVGMGAYMATEKDSRWIAEKCLESECADPSELMEDIFSDSRCVAFGPMHHFIVGACLLTAYSNAVGKGHEFLASALETLESRSSNVPGASCARWGICGAAISAGMAYAIVADNAPLKKEGWAEGQEMVAEIALAISKAGAPRCCKRDSRLAIEIAVKAFERDFGVRFSTATERMCTHTPCAAAEVNSVCLGEGCAYYGA